MPGEQREHVGNRGQMAVAHESRGKILRKSVGTEKRRLNRSFGDEERLAEEPSLGVGAGWVGL